MFGIKKLQADAKRLGRMPTVEPTDHPLLSFFVRTTAQLLGAERCSIFILDPGSKRVWLKRGIGVEDRAIEVEVEGSVAGRVITTGQAVIENDLAHKDGAHRQVQSETGFVTRNMVCVPIRAAEGGAAMGAVQVLNKRQGDFTEADAVELTELARYLQLTIDTIYHNQEMVGVVRWAERVGQVLVVAAAVVTVTLVSAVVLLVLYVATPLVSSG